jgi:purine-binding chemotaxis protein CheW
VQEIKGFEQVTPLPNVPDWFLGVINLRGAVVPVLDLRVRLGLEPRPHDRLTVIVILSIGERIVGLVVDAVSDVVDLPVATIEPPPAIGTAVGSSFLQGIARRESELLLLLDVQRVVGASALAVPAALAA